MCAKSQAADLANFNQKQQTMIFHTVARVKKRLGLIAGTCCILNSWALTPKARIDHFSLQANTFGTLHNLGLMCALPFRLLSKDLLENTFIAQPTLTRLQNQHSQVLCKYFYSDPIFVFTKLCSMRRSSVKFAARADLWNFFRAGMLFPPHAQMIDVS